MAKIFNARLRGRKALIGNREVEFDADGVAEMDADQAAIVKDMKGYKQIEVEPPANDKGAAEGGDGTVEGEGSEASEETAPEGAEGETAGEVTEETTAEDRRIHPDEAGLGTLEGNSETETPVEVAPAGEGQGAAQDDSKQSAAPTISRTPVAAAEKSQPKGKRGGRRGKKSNA